MKLFDAHCSKHAAVIAHQLGWTVATPERLEIKTGNDLRLVKTGMSIVSRNGEWMRQACRKGVLIDPTAVLKFEKDEGLVRAVAATESVFELPLRLLLHAFGRRRAQLLAAFGKFVLICHKRKAKVTFSSQAQNGWDVKSPREAVAVWQQLGLNRFQVQNILETEVRFE